MHSQFVFDSVQSSMAIAYGTRWGSIFGVILFMFLWMIWQVSLNKVRLYYMYVTQTNIGSLLQNFIFCKYDILPSCVFLFVIFFYTFLLWFSYVAGWWATDPSPLFISVGSLWWGDSEGHKLWHILWTKRCEASASHKLWILFLLPGIGVVRTMSSSSCLPSHDFLRTANHRPVTRWSFQF